MLGWLASKLQGLPVTASTVLGFQVWALGIEVMIT